mgnify:CR=1 FL=1
MRYTIGLPQAGKTMDAIGWLLSGDRRVLLVESAGEAKRVISMILESDKTQERSAIEKRVLPWHSEKIQGLPENAELGIDNAQKLIQGCFRRPVKIAWLAKENVADDLIHL